MTCTVYMNRLEELKKVYNRFAKKANAIGLETSLEIGNPYIKNVSVYEYDDIRHCEVKTGNIPVEVVDIELEYPDYKLGNYTVCAVIDHTYGEENAVYPCGDFNVPVEYRHGQGVCEHCRTNHKRNKTVVLIDTYGKYKQVGTSCLKEYTGITDISLVSAFQAMDSFMAECDDRYGHYSGADNYRSIKDYLAYCIHYIRKYGYDKDLKSEAMNRKHYDDITENDYQTAEKVREFFLNGEFRNDFMHNVKCHMQNEYTKESGFIAYAYISYEKEMAKAKEKAVYEYFGNIGDKPTVEVTGKVLTTYTNCYGSIYNQVTTYVYQFTDSANHVFIWKTANDIPLNEDGIFKGTIKGTVKEHSEFNGIKQTVLTRVKVTG